MTSTVHTRMIPDRRKRPTPMFSRFWLRGRRRAGRRAGEHEGIYVDGYTREEWFLAVALCSLSGLDLLLTLAHLAAGGAEANPVMEWALAAGGGWGFAMTKVGLTLGATLVLLVHVRFRLARLALLGLLGLYALLMVWHGVVALDRF